MGGDIGPGVRSARSCTSWHELVTWSTESVIPDLRIWISFRVEPSRNFGFVQNFRTFDFQLDSFSGFSKV